MSHRLRGIVSTLIVVFALTAAVGCGSSSTSSSSDTTSTGDRPGDSTPPASDTSKSAHNAASTTRSSESTTADSTTSNAGIEDFYYPVAPGNTWVYRVDYGSALGLGAVTDTERMTNVHRVAGGTRVTISRTFHYENGRYPDFVSNVDYVFHKDGSLTVPFQNGILTRGTKITVKSGSIVWPKPEELKSGHTSTGHIRATIKSAGRKIDANVLVALRGAGTASVRTPAGSFTHARVLHQDLIEKLRRLGTQVTIRTTTYLVEGIGVVKSTVDSGLPGTNGITTELVSFRRG
jgi:hypothetical protein